MNFTLVAPLKFEPVTVTALPTGPLVGAKLVTAGAGGRTVNDDALVATPPGVVTVSAPVVALAGTNVVICVAELTVKDAVTPLNATAVVPVKLLPAIVTVVPTTPLLGVMLVIAGWAN